MLRATRRAVLALPFAPCPGVTPALAGGRVPVAAVPLRLVEGYPTVPGRLAGQAVSWLVDTGAQGMLVVPGVAERLGLPVQGTVRVDGTGGSRQAPLVGLPDLRVGGAAMPEQQAPVLPLPTEVATDPPLAGLLGASLLSRFELAFDVPGGRMALWAADASGQDFAGGTVLPAELSRAGEVFVPVRVNGATLLALLDTGSRATIIEERTARRLGLEAAASANTAAGVDGTRLPVGHTRMRFGLETEAVTDEPVSLAPLRLERGDMLLGLDQLGRRRFLVRYGSGTVVFAAR